MEIVFNGNVHIIGSRATPHGITLHPNYCPPRPSIKARHVAWAVGIPRQSTKGPTNCFKCRNESFELARISHLTSGSNQRRTWCARLGSRPSRCTCPVAQGWPFAPPPSSSPPCLVRFPSTSRRFQELLAVEPRDLRHGSPRDDALEASHVALRDRDRLDGFNELWRLRFLTYHELETNGK